VRIVLLGMGSRGDVQPFVALAPRLAALGHEVAVAAPSDFRGFVEEHGVSLEPLSFEVRPGVESDLGRRWLRGSSTNQVREAALMRRVVAYTAEALGDDLVRIVGRADAVVSSALTFDTAATLCGRTGMPHVYAIFQPVWPTRYGPSSSFALRTQSRSVLNLAWSGLAGHAAWTIFRQPGDHVRRRTGLPRKSFRDFVQEALATPTVLAASRHVVPRAPDWPDTLTQTGWWFRDVVPPWDQPAGLGAFLDAGDPPVHLGFGSMPTDDPAAVLRAFVAALRTLGRRGVISAGWADLGRAGIRPADLPPEVVVIDGAPHEWLFPRCAALVHHGGGGTTAAAFRSGVPQVVVPHIADQPYWGRRVRDLGVGPAALARKHLTSDTLTAALHEALTPGRVTAAARLGSLVRDEDGVGTAARHVDRVVRGSGG
jgi:sterol 3beta-glucosyltransferase